MTPDAAADYVDEEPGAELPNIPLLDDARDEAE